MTDPDAEPLVVEGYEGIHEELASIPAYSRTFVTQAGARIVNLDTA